MDQFEKRLNSLALRKPSESFGKRETLAETLRHSNQSVPLSVRIKNMSWKSRIAAMASAAALVAFLYVAVSTLSNGTVAFAQVAEKLRRATTLSYKSTVKDADTGEVKMEARHYFMVPGMLRVESSSEDGKGEFDGYSVINFPEKKILVVDLASKVARVSPLEGSSERDMAAENIEHVRTLSDEATRELGQKLVDGVDALGYEIVEKDQTTTVWANAENGDPIRIEILLDSVMTEGRMLLVWTDIKLDERLDPGLFSVAVPAGFEEKPFMKIDLNAPPATFVAGYLRFYAKYMDGKYPEKLLESPKELKGIIDTLKEKNEPSFDDLMKLSMNSAGMIAATRAGKQGERWDYYPDTPPGSADQIVFWIRSRKGEIFAVYGDLHVAEITSDEIPKSPEVTSEEE